MRCPARRLFTLCSAVSLLLALLSFAFWITGHQRTAERRWGGTVPSPWASARERRVTPNLLGTPGFERAWRVKSEQGRLIVERFDYAKPEVIFPPTRTARGAGGVSPREQRRVTSPSRSSPSFARSRWSGRRAPRRRPRGRGAPAARLRGSRSTA